MRILLIQAVSTHDGGEVVFPLGLARMGAVLDQVHEVRGLDMNLSPYPWPELIEMLYEFQPELTAVSFRNLDPLGGNLVSFVPQLKTLAALIKQHCPRSKVIVGGSGFTLFAKRLMEEVPEVRLGYCGEADLPFLRLVENLDTPWVVPGTLWRDDGGSVCGNTLPSYCEYLDGLPLPRWELFDPTRYRMLNRYVAFMGVETKRGCPNRCRYCLYPSLQGGYLRFRSPEKVVDELQVLSETYGIQLVHFTDPVVNQPVEHLRAICREILKRRLNIGWTGFFREDNINIQDMELYCDSGLAAWYFSADGASEYALELLGKGLRRDDILRAAQIAAASGITTVYHFLVNLPGESNRTVRETRELLERLFEIHSAYANLGAVVVNNLRLYPGAPLTEQILSNRLIDPRSDLLYPTYFNPPPWDHLRHELNAYCLRQSTASYAGLGDWAKEGGQKDADSIA